MSLRQSLSITQHISAFIQCLRNDLIHIVIFILRESPTKNDVLLTIGELFAVGIKHAVFLIIDRSLTSCAVHHFTRLPPGS